MGFLNPEGYLGSFEAESDESPEETALTEDLREKTRSYQAASFEDFEGVYSSEEISADKAQMNAKLDRLQQSGEWLYSGGRSQAITNMLLHMAGNLELLKPSSESWDVYANTAHPFDDRMRGTDMVLVFHNTETDEEFPIAIDTTTSEEFAGKKRKRVDRDLREGHLRRLRYHTSPVTNQPVGLQEMPIGIIGFTPDNFITIAREWEKRGDAVFAQRIAPIVRRELLKQFKSQIRAVDRLASTNSCQALKDRLATAVRLLSTTQEKRGE